MNKIILAGFALAFAIGTAAYAQDVVSLPQNIRIVPLPLQVACVPAADMEAMAASQNFLPVFTGKLDTIQKPSANLDDQDAVLTIYYNGKSHELVNTVRYENLGYSCAIGGATGVTFFGDNITAQ